MLASCGLSPALVRTVVKDSLSLKSCFLHKPSPKYQRIWEVLNLSTLPLHLRPKLWSWVWTHVAPLASCVHLFFHLSSSSYAEYWRDSRNSTLPGLGLAIQQGRRCSSEQRTGDWRPSLVLSRSPQCCESLCSLVLGGREDFPGKGSRKERSQPIREGHQHDWASGREALMCLKMRNRGFPAVQWWGHRASPAGGVCSIPGEGTKILKAAQCGPTKKRWERKSLWLMGAHGDNCPGMVGPAGSWLGLAVCLLSLPTWLLQPPHTVDTGQASYMMLTFHETHRSCKAFYDLAWKSLLLHSVGQRESQA